MLLTLPAVLDHDELAHCRSRLAQAGWTDGGITAGYQSARAKRNLQLPVDDPVARELAELVRAALQRNALFFAAALPRHVFAPSFNGYRVGDMFGDHVDNAVRYERHDGDDGRGRPMRADLSATLFLSAAQDYDGGELVIVGPARQQAIKLAAGDMLLYPATSVHRVAPITRGERIASFFWIQSFVRDAGQRELLFELDRSIQSLERDHAGHPALVGLAGTYHNLLRRWTDV